ncbi:TetR/AcrR family transcriptional regulator [Paeniglutamicibacter sp. R2-26]|uniref:TetR/AcrR family transcriptional regulator n=1 Tax=Paeniglutamicibacter sp. R2-26 TaxID=3144417 RepID=UPI003EE7C7C1
MPRKIDHEQRRSDVIAVTRQLIVDGGIEAATMREIAAKAGFANGALKHYFDGKDDIIQATYQEALGQMAEFLGTDMAGRRGLDALETMCQAIMPGDEERITAGRVLISFWERAVNKEPMRQTYLKHLEAWRGAMAGYLAEGRADGDVLTGTPDEQLVDELVLLNVGANVMVLMAPETSTVALQKAHLASFFERLGRP